MESKSLTIIKYLLFAFNLVVFIVGIILIVGGAVMQGAFRNYLAFFGGSINHAAVFIIVVGVVCVVVSFFGCVGAFKENHCMIITFAVLLSIILILEIIAAIAFFVLRSQVQTFLRDNMKLTIPNYENEGVSHAWDSMQKSLGCCGVDSFTDWKDNDQFNASQTVPDSCCLNATMPNCAGSVLDTLDTGNIHVKGCADRLNEWSQRNIAIIGTIVIIFACIQVAGIVLACVLGGGIRQQYQRV